jgi:hypothetical protein
MAGVVQLLAAQIDYEGALIHEPHGLHGAQGRKGVNAGAQLENRNGYRGQQRGARKIGMMGNVL